MKRMKKRLAIVLYGCQMVAVLRTALPVFRGIVAQQPDLLIWDR